MKLWKKLLLAACTALAYSSSCISLEQKVRADLNKDGVPDLVRTEINDSQCGNGQLELQVILYDGKSSSLSWSYQPKDGLRELKVEDINNDGHPDITYRMYDHYSSIRFYVAYSQGDGTFAEPVVRE